MIFTGYPGRSNETGTHKFNPKPSLHAVFPQSLAINEEVANCQLPINKEVGGHFLRSVE